MKKTFYISVIFLIFAEFLFSTMSAFVKLASVSLPLEMLVFFRNFFNLLVIIIYFSITDFYQIKSPQIPLHIIRSILGVIAMYCFFYTMSNAPLSVASLLFMTTPLFIPFTAAILLKHNISKLIVFTVILGFIGVWLILKPENIPTSIAAFTGLFAGFLASIIKVNITQLGKTDNAMTIMFYFMLIASIVSFFPMLWVWQNPSLNEWLFLIAIAGFATTAQFFLTKAYALTSAGLIGGFTYSSVIFSTMYGILLWEDKIGMGLLIGAGFIIVAGLITLRVNTQ